MINRADLSQPVNDGPLGINRFGPLEGVCSRADPAVAAAAGCPIPSPEEPTESAESDTTSVVSATPSPSPTPLDEADATISNLTENAFADSDVDDALNDTDIANAIARIPVGHSLGGLVDAQKHHEI